MELAPVRWPVDQSQRLSTAPELSKIFFTRFLCLLFFYEHTFSGPGTVRVAVHAILVLVRTK